MATPSPLPLSLSQRRARRNRAARIARKFGFVGHTEYRHVYSQSGGAQYGKGIATREDLLTVFAEAFERDSDSQDFSLEAIVAHECGHQLLARHPRISKLVAGRISLMGEEILASLLGAMLCDNVADRDSLVAKAVVELFEGGESREAATRRIPELWDLLGELL